MPRTPDPLIRVVRGDPDPDELAALAAVLLHRARNEPVPGPALGPPPRDTARWRAASAFRAPGDWTAL
ncbi:acyl-CoA carboxylase epsilon subunit [Streptomyces sp. NPDC054841]